MNLKKKHGQGRRWNRILTLVFLAVFLFSLYKIVGILWEYRQIDNFYEETDRNFVQIPRQNEENNSETLLPKVDFEALKKVNEDVIGWIYIEDTNISFPILQGKTNAQYLFQSYKKEYLTAGSIFIDYRCGSDFNDKNTVIYGHNMHNGSMFGSLKKYKNGEYKNEHPYIYILMPDNTCNKYEVIAFYQAAVDGSVYRLPLGADCEEKDFDNLAETIRSTNQYSDMKEMEYEDRFITLSTCTQDSREDIRVAITAKLVETGKQRG